METVMRPDCTVAGEAMEKADVEETPGVQGGSDGRDWVELVSLPVSSARRSRAEGCGALRAPLGRAGEKAIPGADDPAATLSTSLRWAGVKNALNDGLEVPTRADRIQEVVLG